MTRLATLAAALLVAVGCAGGGGPHNAPATPTINRSAVVGLERGLHYFSIGERECRRQLRHQHGPDALVLVRTEPSRYASEIEAGCQAALPTGILPSRYFLLGRRICARAGAQAMKAISRRSVTVSPLHRTAVLQGCWTELNSTGRG